MRLRTICGISFLVTLMGGFWAFRNETNQFIEHFRKAISDVAKGRIHCHQSF